MDLGKVSVESYGCTMNHGEARNAADRLASNGTRILSDENRDEADTVILFTCDVITTTENRMWRRIEEITSEGKQAIVAGCLAAIAKEEIQLRFPEAILLDSMGLHRLEQGIDDLIPHGHAIDVEKSFFSPGKRIDTIVPISTGCAGNCSYCITKIARGRVISYSHSDIKDRIREGVKRGRTEILLTSQDTAAYGFDEAGNDLGTLLRSITTDIKGRFKIRVGMMNPTLALKNFQSIMDGLDHENIFKFLHLPVQTGSDEVLTRMKRGYTSDQYRELLGNIRSEFKDITISTDLIVGFPGETREDHRSSIDLLHEIAPEVLNITRFSSRPGTEAETMKDHIKGSVIKERSREVTRIHSEIVKDRLNARLGYHQECLVTEIGKDGTMMARDRNYIPIVINGGPELLGSYLDIDTSGVGSTYLIGGDDHNRS